MRDQSLLDRYLTQRLPGYVPGRLSSETVAFAAALDCVARELPEIADAILAELGDQRRTLKLIASENFASPAVLLAMGNWLSDKYAEGTPGHRFYAGCEHVDAIESRAAAQRYRRQPGRVLVDPDAARRGSRAAQAGQEVAARAERPAVGDAAQAARRSEDDGHGAGCRRTSDTWL
jgi:glycine hydroxymethyltransferase